MLAMFYEC
jgi:tetratricopeptide (TPR) repeat protein